MYFAKNDLDPEHAETRNIFQQLLKENIAKEMEKQVDIKMFRDQILVDNKPLISKIRIPSHVDILRMSHKEVEDARATKVMPAAEHGEQGSEYYAYVQKVQSAADVNKGLCKLKLKHGDATHISCAYRLQDADGPFNQEGLDDAEHGAGHTILKSLKAKGLQNIAVFIIRYYGGVKLGPRRFKIIETLTAKSISMYQVKSKEKRQRAFHAGSQESIESTLSALSFQHEEEDLTASETEEFQSVESN